MENFKFDKAFSFYKENKLPLIIAITQWYISFFFRIDRLFGYFTYNSEGKIYWTIKLFYLVTLFFLWKFVFYCKAAYKTNKTLNRTINFFLLHFIIMLVLIFAIWPGTWSWDDVGVSFFAGRYELLAWQHILTSFFHMLFMQLLPFPGGYIIIQNVVISAIISYIVVKTENLFLNDRRFFKIEILDMTLKILPFIVLTPVLIYQFSGFRCGLLSYIQLLFLCIIAFKIKEESQWNRIFLLFYCSITVLLSTWRTENFLFSLLGVIVLIFGSKKRLPAKDKLIGCVLIVIGFFFIQGFQKKKLDNNNYNVSGTIMPCTELVKIADEESDKDILAKIDKVLNVNFIKSHPNYNGESILWVDDGIRNNYTDNDYNEYLKAFLVLSLKYPISVLKERMQVFLGASAFYGATNRTPILSNNNTARLFDKEYMWNHSDKKDIFQEYKLNYPPRKSLRKNLIRIMSAMNKDFSANRFYFLVWNLIVPFSAIIILEIYFLFRKKWLYFVMLGFVLLKVFLVFLTAPAPYFMYYINEYLLGYCAIFYLILKNLAKPRNKMKYEN